PLDDDVGDGRFGDFAPWIPQHDVVEVFPPRGLVLPAVGCLVIEEYVRGIDGPVGDRDARRPRGQIGRPGFDTRGSPPRDEEAETKRPIGATDGALEGLVDGGRRPAEAEMSRRTLEPPAMTIDEKESVVGPPADRFEQLERVHGSAV